jgi:DNA modification methylase
MSGPYAFVEPAILHADARSLPLPANSVDLVVTSPPFLGLRSYTDHGRHYPNQVGAETSPQEYVDTLIACTREMVRVLTPSGSLFVNLGDRYSSDRRRNTGRRYSRRPAADSADPHDIGVPAKSLMGIPWRYALRCIDELGLLLRAEIVWSKPRGLPESVTDRVRRSHETWFHFTLNQHYYSALDTLREPHAPASYRRAAAHRADPARSMRAGHPYGDLQSAHTLAREQMLHPLGRLPGSVWTIPAQPLRVPIELGVDHYATFPTEWPRRLILGWSPHQVCTACRQGRRPVPTAHGLDLSRPQTRRAVHLAREFGLTEAHLAALRAVGTSDTPRGGATQAGAGRNTAKVQGLARDARRVLGGYAREFLLSRPTSFTDLCACPDTTAPTTPGVVLDPFGGSGTTALVAAVHGRRGVSVDASSDYCRLARWRVHDPRQQTRAAGGQPQRGATSAAPPQAA